MLPAFRGLTVEKSPLHSLTLFSWVFSVREAIRSDIGHDLRTGDSYDTSKIAGSFHGA
jgi:hypothetical protein